MGRSVDTEVRTGATGAVTGGRAIRIGVSASGCGAVFCKSSSKRAILF